MSTFSDGDQMASQKPEATNEVEFEFATVDHDSASYEVQDLRTADDATSVDWMSRLLLNEEFQMLPAANLQAIFSRLEPLQQKAGDIVIKQGSTGDYFYVLTAGICDVIREMPGDKDDIVVARLSVGDTFGEEALITGAERQATIRMVTNGQVMRLNKGDFEELLSGPIVTKVDADAAESIIEAGGRWLDVSLTAQSGTHSRADATKIPMYLLRLKLDQLDKAQHYVVTSSMETHSCAAAHILRQYGFEASVLQ